MANIDVQTKSRNPEIMLLMGTHNLFSNNQKDHVFFYPQDTLVYTQGLRPTNLKPKVYQTRDINF